MKYPRVYRIYRTFPLSNAARKSEARYASDIEEMAEEGISSDEMPRLRNGRNSKPDAWYDVPRSDLTKWVVKRKGTRHRDRATIRRMPQEDIVA